MLRVGDVLDTDRLQPDDGQDADRENEDRDQRLEQHDAVLPFRCLRVSSHGALRPQHDRGSVTPTTGSHIRRLPPPETSTRRQRIGPAGWQLPPAGLLTSNCVTVAEASGFASTLPSGANVTVVAAAGVIVSTAFGESTSCTRLWTVTPVPASVTGRAELGS